MPHLYGMHNALLMDDIIKREPLLMTWRSALAPGVKAELHSIHAEMCAMHALYGMALSNEAVAMVDAVGPYELDASLGADERRACDERLKLAADMLCRASGVFGYLADRLVPQWDTIDETRRVPELTLEGGQALAKYVAVQRLLTTDSRWPRRTRW